MARDAPAARDRAARIPRGGLTEGEVREGAMEGALVAAGELGYREMSVRSILEHSGGHRAQFYEHFESREDCFAQAYAAWIERLVLDLMEAAATAASWEEGVREAIVRLFRFVTSKPAIARALLLEPQIAGEPALSRHEAAMERFAGAIDGAREEVPPEAAPPQATASFVAGGIEACACEALSAGDPARVWDALPELMHFAAGSYFGREKAEGAFERASELLVHDRAAITGEAS